MSYILKHKDNNIAYFTIEKRDVIACTFSKYNIEQLPLPLKRLIQPGQKEEFIAGEDTITYELNEDGCFLFDEWLSNREIPVNRDNYKSYISDSSSPREWLLKNHGYSFDDCYWVQRSGESLQWDDILHIRSSVDSFYAVKDKDGRYKGHSATLGGQLEKFWFKKDNKILLCKRTDDLSDILMIRETIASLIYSKQDSIAYCEYKLAYNREHKIVGCICESFISDNMELVTAYDLLEEHNLTQSRDVWEQLIKHTAVNGLDKTKVRRYLDTQTIVDFLISNRDRHQNNIAFIRDADTLKLLRPAPVFDSGSSKYMEGTNPETLFNTSVNGLYSTEIECLEHVSDFNSVDISLLPSAEDISALLSESFYLSDKRKAFLVQMYTDKVNLLTTLQKLQVEGENTSEYLHSKTEECKGQDIEDFFVEWR